MARSAEDILIAVGSEAELFHTGAGTAYADVRINGRLETLPLRGREFRQHLTHRYFAAQGRAPGASAVRTALETLDAKANVTGVTRDVALRVGADGDRLYLDLQDADRTVIEVGPDGWAPVTDAPVRFRRLAGMQALPKPEPGGSIMELRPFLNAASDDDFQLIVAWILAAMRPRGPYPCLVLSGEQGAAKSTNTAFIRALVDPNVAPLRALPTSERDLFIAANNGHVLAYDNVSVLPHWLSDTLCRLATGGGFATRRLFSDQDEALFEAQRPVILNSIAEVIERPDLADRGVFLTLLPIPEQQRRPEGELREAFMTARPRILGALLDAVAHGLRVLPETHLEGLPRMADFALWATACEGALWPPGQFRRSYGINRTEAISAVIDNDAVACAVRTLITKRPTWSGTATELLSELGIVVAEEERKARTWPRTANALSGRLRRSATFLRKVGIEIEFTREGHGRTRTLTVSAAQGQNRPST